MQVIFGILMTLVGAASGSLFQDPVVCTFNENDQCYVALGRQLHLKIPLVDIFNLYISSQNRYILKFSKFDSDPPKLYNSRWQFVNETDTLILTSAENSDSGTYTIDTFHATGIGTGKYTLQLHTEAEVSSVSVRYSCSPTEDIKVYCSADGDDLTYSWTSDFHTISQVENGTITQTLSKEYQGNVTCYVKNHVSQSQRSIVVQPCRESTTTVTTVISKYGSYNPNIIRDAFTKTQPYIMTFLGGFCVIIILLFIAEFYMYRKKSQKSKAAPPQYDEGEMNQEP